MSVADLLQDLVLKDWRFWLEEGRLKYRAPEGQVNESLLEQLRQHKQEIIRILTTSPELVDVCQLSHGQRALWFLWALSPQSIAYHQSWPIRIPAGSEAQQWKAACRLLVERHAMLRTSFPKRIEEPIQRIHSTFDPDWAESDASTWSDAELSRELQAAHAEPFDPENRPPVRFRWFAHCDRHDILLVTMHHIVCDGWSLEIMRRELPRLRRSIAEGTTLPPPSHSYRDYVTWHSRLLNGADGDRLWSYWRNQLSHPLPTSTLATDHPRPTEQFFRGACCHFEIPDHIVETMRDLAREESTTSYVTMLASLFVLLFRDTGQNDLLVGSPHSGRSRAEFGQIIGYFVNPIVVRARPAADQVFRDFLRDVRKTTLQALDHADFPFPLIVEKLQPERHPGRSPIFDVSFNYVSRREWADADIGAENGSVNDSAPREIEVFDIPQADGKFDLTLTICESESGMTAAFGFNKDLFERLTIERLGDAYIGLLDDIASRPDRTLASLCWPSSGGGLSGPVAVGQPLTDPRSARLIHELFEEQAALHPARTAVVAGNGTLTYAELNARANSLARHLIASGVVPETRVGVNAARTVDFAVAMLAVLKAGGAYVPLDMSHPTLLLAQMVTHLGIGIVIGATSLPERFPQGTARVLSLDSLATQLATCSCENPRVAVTSRNLAYVIFTSGSTGIPKGVAIEHRSISNYAISILRDLKISDAASFALVSTLAADLGNTMLFPSLCSGGCLHLVPHEVTVDSAAFANYLSEHRIDYLKIVPSHLAALTDGADARRCLPRKAVILGGESSSSSWVAELQSLAPDCKFFNHYGPTEATVGVLTRPVDSRDANSTANVALRTAIAGVEIYIFDQQQHSVPTGATGELYIGGVCLARGYINDAELTAAKFWRHPSMAVENEDARLYRTGDLARQLPGGDIELLGRQDRQIKIRGFRVELGQIESILSRNPRVRRCAVLAVGEDSASVRIVAFVVPDDLESGKDGESEKEGHRERLAGVLLGQASNSLPQAMVPEEIRILDALPLTSNGKIDHAALKRLHVASSPTTPRKTARDPVEFALSRMWRELLGVSQIGIRDDFFQQGGHSLMAVRLAARIQSEFHVRLPLATFFTHRTIEQLASLLRSSSGELIRSALVPIRRQGTGPRLFCLPGAGGSVLYFHDLATCLDSDQPVWGLQALGLDEASAIPTRVEEIAARYVQTIQRELQPQGPYYLAGHSLGGLIAFEMARLFRRQGEEVAFLGILDNPAPDLTSDERYLRWGHADWLLHIATRIGKLYGTALPMTIETFAGMDRDRQTGRLIDLMLAAGLLPDDVERSHFSRFLEVYQANAIAGVSYRPEDAPIDIGITVFRAVDDDPELRRVGAAAGASLGWNRYSAEIVEEIEVPGTHITMMIPPNARELGRRLGESIERARRRSEAANRMSVKPDRI